MIHNNTFKADFSDKGQLIRLEFNNELGSGSLLSI